MGQSTVVAITPPSTPPSTPRIRDDVKPVVSATIAHGAGAGSAATLVQKPTPVPFAIGARPGSYIGAAAGNIIDPIANAASRGWFIDPMPTSEEEFASSTASPQLLAINPQALDRIDLLTVVEHELDHTAGLPDMDALADDMMSGVLGNGQTLRRRTAPR
jgi:hypothetical protein